MDVSFREALRFWLKLGFISFGGPAGQIAIMHEELVDRRRWISEPRFLHALNYCMVLPGPEAQQLATYIGWLLHGPWGGIVAGALFVLPSLFILLALSWIYVTWGGVPFVAGILYGVKPAVVAVVVYAAIRIARRATTNGVLLAIAIGAFLAMYVLRLPFPAVIAAAAVVGFLGSRWRPGFFQAEQDHVSDTRGRGARKIRLRIDGWGLARRLAIGTGLWALVIAPLAAWQGWNGLYTQMGWFFTKAAVLTFGGAYAVLPYVAQNAIGNHWLTPGQMIDGLALGETTPGPLIMIVTFVGFVGAWQSAGSDLPGAVLGGLVATYFTFLPSFLFILIGAPLVEATRGNLRLTAPLSAITAAVVGVILNLAVFFAGHVFLTPKGPDGIAAAIAAAGFVALQWRQWDIVRVVVAAGAVGLAARVLL